MAKNRTATNAANRIADAIVELVERVGGPVTLTRIEREVSGFAARSGQAAAWCYEVGDAVMWYGMTKAGCDALRLVLTERRVTTQPGKVRWLVHFLDGRLPPNNLFPLDLLPASMANLETPRLLVCGSADILDQCMARAAA